MRILKTHHGVLKYSPNQHFSEWELANLPQSLGEGAIGKDFLLPCLSFLNHSEKGCRISIAEV